MTTMASFSTTEQLDPSLAGHDHGSGSTEMHNLQPLCRSSTSSRGPRPSSQETPDSSHGSRIGQDFAPSPPAHAVDAQLAWNSPPINKYRVGAAYLSFLVGGMNDGAYGALIPHIGPYFDLSYTTVSLIFLAPFAGYALSSAVNNLIHVRLGQRGVAYLGPSFHLIPYLIISFHPPYPAVVVLYVLIGFGNGITDAAFNAWTGNMRNGHQVTGGMHTCYALGATIAPLIATALITQASLGWWSFYYVMAGMAFLELCACVVTFWGQTASVYLAENPQTPGQEPAKSTSGRTRLALRQPLTWIFAVFMLLYNGTEVSLGGWIVTFMTTVRNSSEFAAGATATGFWGGMTLGRLLLPFVTSYLGELRAVLLYLAFAVAFQLVFWLVPRMIVTAVAAACLGVISGPIYPAAVVLMTKVLPRSVHVGAIGFATAVGGSGSALVPFAVGAIAQAKGVETLQPIVLALLVSLGVLWIILHRIAAHKTAKESTHQA